MIKHDKKCITCNLCHLKKQKQKEKLHLEAQSFQNISDQRCFPGPKQLIVLEPLPGGQPGSSREGRGGGSDHPPPPPSETSWSFSATLL